MHALMHALLINDQLSKVSVVVNYF